MVQCMTISTWEVHSSPSVITKQVITANSIKITIKMGLLMVESMVTKNIMRKIASIRTKNVKSMSDEELSRIHLPVPRVKITGILWMS
jgi:hypothetical protein